jgi:hypothetical protein
MDKNIHNIDDIFSKAYLEYEENPSLLTWEKLNSSLDKEDTKNDKKLSIGWRQIGILLVFLLSGLAIYESRILSKVKATNRFVKKDYNKDSISIDIINSADDVAWDTHGKLETRQKSEKFVQPTLKLKETPNIVYDEIKGSDARKDNDSLSFREDRNEYEIDYKQKEIIPQKSLIIGKKEIFNFGRNDKPKILNKVKKTEIDNNHFPGSYLMSTNKLAQQKSLMASSKTIPGSQIYIINIPIPKIQSISISDSIASKLVLVAINKKALKQFKHSWALTAFASNEWGQYHLDNDLQYNNGNNQEEKEEIKNREKHESSFSAGVLASQQLTNKWGLKTGVIYSNSFIAIDPHEMYAYQKPDGTVAYKYITSSGFGYVKPNFGFPPSLGDSLQSSSAQHNLQTISIPLMLFFKFDKNKFSVIPSAGITANVISHSSVQTEIRDAVNKEPMTINNLNGMRNFYAGFIANVSLTYNSNSRWSFNLFPVIKYAFTPITKSNVVKTYPYSFGIGTGATYKF